MTPLTSPVPIPAPSNKFMAVLDVIAGYAKKVPGLTTYLYAGIEDAVKLVEALAKVNTGQAFNDWKTQALAALKAKGDQGRAEWQEILINLAYETVKGESQRFFLFRWFIKLRDFVVRAGLNQFLAAYFKQALTFFEEEIAKPGATFEGVGQALFNYISKVKWTDKGTWIAVAVNLVKAVVSANV